MLKISKLAFLIACLLLVSCNSARIKFGPKYEVTKTEVSARVKPAEQAVETPLLRNADIASNENDVADLFTSSQPAPVTVLDSTEQQSTAQENATDKPAKKKKKKEASVFKEGMQMSGISSGLLALAIPAFFLSGISIYIPVVGIILCIAGIYFFVRGFGAYLDAKKTLQWYPPEYAKAQKFGWATTILIVNFVMLAVAAVGIFSLVF